MSGSLCTRIIAVVGSLAVAATALAMAPPQPAAAADDPVLGEQLFFDDFAAGCPAGGR